MAFPPSSLSFVTWEKAVNENSPLLYFIPGGKIDEQDVTLWQKNFSERKYIFDIHFVLLYIFERGDFLGYKDCLGVILKAQKNLTPSLKKMLLRYDLENQGSKLCCKLRTDSVNCWINLCIDFFSNFWYENKINLINNWIFALKNQHLFKAHIDPLLRTGPWKTNFEYRSLRKREREREK